MTEDLNILVINVLAQRNFPRPSHQFHSCMLKSDFQSMVEGKGI